MTHPAPVPTARHVRASQFGINNTLAGHTSLEEVFATTL